MVKNFIVQPPAVGALMGSVPCSRAVRQSPGDVEPTAGSRSVQDSNRRPSDPQAKSLQTELLPPMKTKGRNCTYIPASYSQLRLSSKSSDMD